MRYFVPVVFPYKCLNESTVIKVVSEVVVSATVVFSRVVRIVVIWGVVVSSKDAKLHKLFCQKIYQQILLNM